MSFVLFKNEVNCYILNNILTKVNSMYIVFEGIDGAGKSTQIQLLKEWLEDNGLIVETLVEPTDSEVGKLIRKILQRPDAETDKVQKTLGLLFAADRMLIMDKLSDDKKVIISDRSFISSLAYQEPAEWIEVLNRLILMLPAFLFGLSLGIGIGGRR